jgi:hypothetical protein
MMETDSKETDLEMEMDRAETVLEMPAPVAMDQAETALVEIAPAVMVAMAQAAGLALADPAEGGTVMAADLVVAAEVGVEEVVVVPVEEQNLQCRGLAVLFSLKAVHNPKRALGKFWI